MNATAEHIGAAAGLVGLGILTLLSVRGIGAADHRKTVSPGVPEGTRARGCPPRAARV